jgi:hypothetical protein
LGNFRGCKRELVAAESHLGDDVTSLFIADLDNNNIDDIQAEDLRLGYWATPATTLSGRAFAGRFSVAPGGGVVLTGSGRIGYFHSPAEKAGALRLIGAACLVIRTADASEDGTYRDL